MKERELREHAVCTLCGERIGHTGLPMFWTVKITRWGLDHGALERQTGREMAMGGHVLLAQLMGPNEDMAKPIMDEVEITVCETCATEERRPLMAMLPEAEVDRDLADYTRNGGEG